MTTKSIKHSKMEPLNYLICCSNALSSGCAGVPVSLSPAPVVEEEGGTAYWYARSELVSIGGKTGTSQVVGRYAEKKLEDHAWFIAFAPIENPKIVVAVIVEHGGHGGCHRTDHLIHCFTNCTEMKI